MLNPGLLKGVDNSPVPCHLLTSTNPLRKMGQTRDEIETEADKEYYPNNSRPEHNKLPHFLLVTLAEADPAPSRLGLLGGLDDQHKQNDRDGIHLAWLAV